MSYDELELDKLGDEKSALFFLISDTDTTYNFLVALAFSQMFNLLCERADNTYGGRLPYHVRVLNSIDFSKSMHYNPLAYIKTESDVLKFVTALIANTKGDGKEGDEFWTKAETLLYCALVAYIVFEGPEEERNMNTLVEMINSMEVREDDETFKNAVD